MSDDTEKVLESAYGHLEPDPALGERLLDSLPEERLAPRTFATPAAALMGLLVIVAVTLALWSGSGPESRETSTFLPSIRFVTEGDIQRTAEVMRSRLESLGVIGARVETDPEGMDVSLPEKAPVEIVRATLTRPGSLEFRIVVEEREGKYVFEEPANPTDAFGGDDIEPDSVVVHPPQGRGYTIGIEILDDRRDDFTDFTRRYLRRRLGIVVDGEVISAPIIQDVIPGQCLISGGGLNGFTKEEAESLAAALRSGAYPEKVEIR